MRKIDFDEMQRWCLSRGYSLDKWKPSLSTPVQSLDIALPSQPHALPELIDSLVNLANTTERLVWIRDWTIWAERSQELGLCHLALVTTHILPKSHDQRSHIYLLEAAEWRETAALLTVPALYGWDAHLFFGSGIALVSFSHEERVVISVLAASILQTLQGWSNA